MKSVVFILRTLNGGGAQRECVTLANELCKRHRVAIFVLRGKNCAYEIDPAVKICRCPEPADLHGLALRIRKNLPALYRVLWCRKAKRQEGADVAISLLPNQNLLNVFSRAGEKVIVKEGSDPLAVGKSHMRKEWLAMHLADHVFFQSVQVQSYYDRKIQAKSTVVPNPVSVTEMALPVRANRIVTVGKLLPQKNHHLLIDAFFEFQKTHVDYVLDIYGIGDLEADLARHISELDLQGKVTLKGFAANVHKEIRDAKMFVLSSNHEGLCNALLEAMMMGIACVSTDVAGSTEVIKNMENGILVKKGDPLALSGAMGLLADDDSIRNKLEKNGRKTAESFEVERVAPIWEALM